MAIQIRSRLTASPNPTSLPRRIDFRQTLRSNQNGEQVVLEYQMDPAHDVWFVDGDGELVKTIQRSVQVSRADQPVLTRIPLQRGPGTGPMVSVQIDQTITDSAGIKIPDSCVLGIAVN
ncbi:MAG TPA: hypothetical protein VGM86_35135 [Thermoanaerobaculia bacterium]|jgi:hypothetical protein